MSHAQRGANEPAALAGIPTGPDDVPASSHPASSPPSSSETVSSQTVSSHTATRQQIMYCPYCAEETLFPLERGWECRSCGRAFSITFLGLRPLGADRKRTP
jgi:hypothetical protein